MGGRPTWYGSSTQGGAWAEFARSLPDGTDLAQFQRRIGRVDFDLFALDLRSPRLQRALGVEPRDLTSDDRAICQALADLAADAGFDAVIGPSGARADDTTLAVFGDAIAARASNIDDLGARRAVSPR